MSGEWSKAKPYPGLKQLRDHPDRASREKRMMEAKAALSKDMKAWADKFKLTADEVLALCAYMTGAAIAMQDQRTTTPELAMQVVIANIEAGNQTVIEQLLAVEGSRQ